jgi:methylated-DNA-[protein]-cysteine S-methyltransferase
MPHREEEKMMEMLYLTRIESPVGELTLVASQQALLVLTWGDASSGSRRVAQAVQQATVVSAGQHLVLAQCVSQLEEYFAGHRTAFDLPLQAEGTEFQRAAWNVLRQIPYGQTLSYAEQAGRAGSPKASRAVGSANGRNPISIIVPCHRVIGADGSLTGFGGGLDTKRWLLAHEQRVLNAK